MKFLGERIKKRRESLGMQLNDLSKRVGVSSSALSQIEKAKSYPTILTLKNIADNLHTTVSELIGEHEALSANPLVKYSEKKFIERNESGTSVFLMSQYIDNKQMDALLFVFGPGADSDGLLKTHHGQTYMFVVKGELHFLLEEEKYVLKKNDSVYFNSKRPHKAENKSGREVHVLLVNTPPVKYN